MLVGWSGANAKLERSFGLGVNAPPSFRDVVRSVTGFSFFSFWTDLCLASSDSVLRPVKVRLGFRDTRVRSIRFTGSTSNTSLDSILSSQKIAE
jgi:hypothetical protein